MHSLPRDGEEKDDRVGKQQVKENTVNDNQCEDDGYDLEKGI